ncbi:type II secretion system F family protein [Streptacidiphilus griseoplanus]|uniref:type II secretion system F family protein n=1 Tax=Peterkaempfera griseoplana TaxID=66896 RepID=UPI000AB8F4D7|nr:type II secretion system F family protein [Peterkaempfera griseoplana]
MGLSPKGRSRALLAGRLPSWRPRPRQPAEPAAGHRRLRRLAPWAGGAGSALLIGGLPGLTVGLLLGVALHRGTARLPAVDIRSARLDRRLVEQLPLTAELLAACMGASGPPSDAAAAVARAVGSPMRERLASVAAELRMGADPADCWGRLADGCAALAPLGRCLARASTSGAPPSATLARLAEEQRAAAARAATARTRKAGVLATAPLGGCFLPAFVLIGIVPVVTGLASAFLERR